MRWNTEAKERLKLIPVFVSEAPFFWRSHIRWTVESRAKEYGVELITIKFYQHNAGGGLIADMIIRKFDPLLYTEEF